MRLIDADALYEEHTRLAYEGDYAFHITARAWLEKQPTIDAVPVVRCGECKWCKFLKSATGNYSLQVCGYKNAHGMVVNETDYCSSGVRKKENQNGYDFT